MTHFQVGLELGTWNLELGNLKWKLILALVCINGICSCSDGNFLQITKVWSWRESEREGVVISQHMLHQSLKV